jgi:hypothetical protein
LGVAGADFLDACAPGALADDSDVRGILLLEQGLQVLPSNDALKTNAYIHGYVNAVTRWTGSRRSSRFVPCAHVHRLDFLRTL